MLKAVETAAFLDKAERFSKNWTDQLQFVRDEFLPQLEALNQHIAERSHVPDISREELTAFMRKSTAIAPYLPRVIAILGEQRSYAAQHRQISSEGLISVTFPNELLSKSLGAEHDFAMYFDSNYKEIMKGGACINPNYCSNWNNYDKPARIHTNYDFYIEIKCQLNPHGENVFQEALMTILCGYTQVTAVHVPLSGDKINRKHISLSFIALAPAPTAAVPTLVDPSDAQLAAFLSKRRRYIHPVVVLDYLREGPRPDIRAFFTTVSQYDLAEAKDAQRAADDALTRAVAEVEAFKLAKKSDAARLLAAEEAYNSQTRAQQQQVTQLNAAALRIRKLEIKLKQTEQLYEDLQLRIIEDEDMDEGHRGGGVGGGGGGGGVDAGDHSNGDDVTVGRPY